MESASVRAAVGGEGAQARIARLAQLLRHPDPSQLFFQVAEIAGEQTYLRGGIEVRPGDVVLDVGANVGVAAAFFAVLCEAGAVHCFEPVAPICTLLRQNVAALPACSVHEYGISSHDGMRQITYYPGASAMSGLYADPERDRELVRSVLRSHGHTETEAEARVAGRYQPVTLECKLRTLSGFLRDEPLERIDLLKVDVERAELDVLAGIEEPDWPRIRQIVIEVHDEDGRGELIAGTLQRRGYQVCTEQEPAMRDTSIRMLYATRA